MSKEPVKHASKPTFIRFMAPVTPQTTDSLIRKVDEKIAEGCDEINLLISSPGGSVFHGLSLYNFFCGMPVKLKTYNFGSVDSIGVIIFCAGKERYSVPHARFLLHPVSMSFGGNMSLDEHKLHEFKKSLTIDQDNIAKVIADTTGKKKEDVMSDIHERTTLNPSEAEKYGLIHRIKSEAFPASADFYAIGEYAHPPQPAAPFQFPFQMVAPANNYFSYFPNGFNYSSIYDRGVAYTDTSDAGRYHIG